MMHVAAVVVWVTMGLVGYIYLGYPLVLWIISRLWRRNVQQEDITPSVTLLISAFNEASTIGAKLENSVALDYPRDRLEVIVISDASNDDTDCIVQSFARQGITLLRMPARRGKTVGLNAAIQVARGDIVVFSDANILYQKDALCCLVRNFADPTVGCVTGDSRYVDSEPSAAHVQEDTYWGYERQIRTLESHIGNTVGGDGAIFAIRRELYTPLPPEAINDLVTPLQIVTRGYRAVFEPAAVGLEPSTGNFRGEFRRKRRIVNRSWRGMMSVPGVLNPWHVGLFAWQVWSHKVLRWLVLPLVVVAGTGCFIAAPLGFVYQLGAWGFIGSLIVAGLGSLIPNRVVRLTQLAHGMMYFYLVNLAAVLGIAMATTGRVETLWTPERNVKPEGLIGVRERTSDAKPLRGWGQLRQWVKRRLSSSLQEGLYAAKDALQLRLHRPGHRQLWLQDWREQLAIPDAPAASRRSYQGALLNWLRQAQDAVPGGGVAACYALADGWSAAYPETTGYIIVTCLEAAKRLNDMELETRARRMADWELDVQLPEGAWQAGYVTAPRVPAVFNTGQVIQGLLVAYNAFGDTNYLEAAVRGGQWLVANQDQDGAWRRYTYNDFPNSYSTRVAWPLLALAHATGDKVFRSTALRYLQWARRCQDETGWLDRCNLEVGESPLTHTLAYATEGFIESGVLLDDERWIAAGQQTADALLHRYEIRRHLAGTYSRGWRGNHSFSCLTGCAQMSLVWGRLFELTQDTRYLNGALKLNDFVVSYIDLKSQCQGIRGGVKGSHPLGGPYMPYRLPSWAVKFTLDALFQEEDALVLLGGEPVEHYDLV